MKKAFLFASLLLGAFLAGCSHPQDITDDVALVAGAAAQA